MSDKPREFWIIGSVTGMSCYTDCEDQVLTEDPKDASIHVIEKSAFDELKEENEKLKSALASEEPCDRYLYTQYCQNMDYGYTKELEAKDAEIARLRELSQQMILNWHNCSMLIQRMSRKKSIEQVHDLYEKGKHLIYSEILRDVSTSNESGGKNV